MMIGDCKAGVLPTASFAAAIMLGISAHKAVAQPRPVALEPEVRAVWNQLEGQAAADVFRYAQSKRLSCWRDGRDQPCSLAEIVDTVRLHHAPPDAGRQIALAVISFSPDTGNALWLDMPLMERGTDGRYRKVAEVKGLVGFPERVSFTPDLLTITTTTLRENDARCCPSGRTTWRVNARTGAAVYVSGYRGKW
jgi:hypothetical protein